ncbi:Putative ankyrin repeat protein L93, partial [Geodia barretti]
MACYNNDLTTTSVLLRAGAYPNSCNKFGQTPLLLAVRKYNVAMVKELIGAGVDVNKMEQEGLSALMMCCDDGNSEMAKLLLDYQANPDLQQSETGYTALMFACKGGHLDTVIGLMEHGADAKIRNVAAAALRRIRRWLTCNTQRQALQVFWYQAFFSPSAHVESRLPQ